MPSKLVVTQGIRKNNLYHFQRSTIIGLATTTTIDDEEMLQIKYFLNTCSIVIRRPIRQICTHAWFFEVMAYVLSLVEDNVSSFFLIVKNDIPSSKYLNLVNILRIWTPFGIWHLKMHFEKMMVNELLMNILNSGSI